MDISFGGPIFGSRGIGPWRRTRATMCQAAAEYAGRWGWPVALGAAAPERPVGRGAVDDGAALAPGAGPAEAQRALAHGGCAALLLPLGGCFDLLDVPEEAGRRAMVRLERMGTRLGPVLASPTRRALFFVAPGAAEALPELLYKTGWDDAALDLAGHGAGGWVAAPPTVLAAQGPMRWLLPPGEGTALRPPEARLLLGTLAYACHRGHEPVGSGAGAGWVS
jgi:hypothetical protein